MSMAIEKRLESFAMLFFFEKKGMVGRWIWNVKFRSKKAFAGSGVKWTFITLIFHVLK